MNQLFKHIHKSKFLQTTLFHSTVLEQTQCLGRWKIENEYKTNLKADYANDDHCGVCTMTKQNMDSDDDDIDDKYYSMYVIDNIQDVSKP